MALEDFEQMTNEELRAKADEFLGRLDGAGALDQPVLLMQAQFYLNELTRRQQERERKKERLLNYLELLLTVIIVLMIGWEIKEGTVQGAILERMNANAEAQVKNIAALQEQQRLLLEEQKKSVHAMQQMGGVLENQLGILSAEQKRRLEEASKKPHLMVSIAGKPLLELGKVQAKEQTEGHYVYAALVTNDGTAIARSITLRIFTERAGVKFSCRTCRRPEPLPTDLSGDLVLLELNALRPGEQFYFLLTVEYVPGAGEFGGFRVQFNGEADDLPNSDLGILQITPARVKK